MCIQDHASLHMIKHDDDDDDDHQTGSATQKHPGASTKHQSTATATYLTALRGRLATVATLSSNLAHLTVPRKSLDSANGVEHDNDVRQLDDNNTRGKREGVACRGGWDVFVFFVWLCTNSLTVDH